jgi:hypothetical protein
MLRASAEFYDLIYSTFKDYVAEVEQIPVCCVDSTRGPARSLTLRVALASTRDCSLPKASSWMA